MRGSVLAMFGEAPNAEALRTLARVRRSYAEKIVETLLDAFDSIDDDPDLEDDETEVEADTEPNLGAPEQPSWYWLSQTRWAAGGDCGEREIENEHGDVLDEGEADNSDDEPGHEEEEDYRRHPCHQEGLRLMGSAHG